MSGIAILGAGAWGTALAINLTNTDGTGSHGGNGPHRVTLWSRLPATAAAMQHSRENSTYLPGFLLPESVEVTSEIDAAVNASGIIISAVPSAHLRSTCEQIAPLLDDGHTLISATKGIEDETGLRMSEVIQQVLASRKLECHVGVLSGPSFAQEVASGLPAALTLAFSEPASADRMRRMLSNATLRLYTNEDVIGVELGGALKNVIAIASGVVAGLQLGHNATAALITRGIAEITRLAVACGGRRETLTGLSGIGDLVLTCTGSLSRNRLVGIELGKGRQLDDILTGLNGKVAEGVRTTFATLDLARKHSIEMPITEQMAAILSAQKSPTDAIRELMARPGRAE